MLHFCPFDLTRQNIRVRGGYDSKDEQFFILKGKIPVTADMVRATLKKVLKAINLNEKSFQSHSFRIGRCCDLVKLGFSVTEIQKLGRWRSNAVYKYMR